MNILKTDHFYKRMYEYYKNNPNFTEILKKSGALEEKRTLVDESMINNDSLLTLPIVLPKTEKKVAVIISTGSFSPLHSGHIEAIKLTKKLAESEGYEVTQGIVSLSHDGYVNVKNNGTVRNHITNRTMLAYEKIESMGEQGWLKVDRFEGETLSIPVNFTTVIERTIKLIENYLKKEITVFYTFGSDNVGFAYAFVNQEKVHAVCVEREGYVNKKIIENINQPNIHYVMNNDIMNYKISSTLIRKTTNKKYPVNEIKKENKKPVYLIRDNSVPEEFNLGLKKIFEKYINSDIQVRNYSTINKTLKGYVSLDKFIKGDINIETSRQFEISSFQRKAEGMVFFEDLKINTKNKKFILIDDDIVSGFTINKVQEYLKGMNIEIDKIETIVDNYINSEEEYLYDVVDSRDFYLNGFKSGLMTIMPNKENKRMPYIFPYVNLTTRANIPTEFQVMFSKDVLELNKKLNIEGFNDFKAEPLLNMYDNFLNTEEVMK